MEGKHAEQGERPMLEADAGAYHTNPSPEILETGEIPVLTCSQTTSIATRVRSLRGRA